MTASREEFITTILFLQEQRNRQRKARARGMSPHEVHSYNTDKQSKRLHDRTRKAK